MRTRVQKSAARRICTLSVLASTVFPLNSARAGVCDGTVTPQSCYTLRPDFKLVTQGTVSLPAAHPVPYHWHEAEKTIPPPAARPGEYWTKPGLDLNLAVGVFGTGSGEPMALARTRFRYTTDTSIQYISPTNGSNGIWYRFACVEGTPLCYRDEQNELDVWKNGTAGLHRRYRLTKINPGTLPRGVTHAPILVDYKMAHVIDGTYKQGGMTVPGLRSKTTVAFGHYESGANGKYVFRQSIVQGFGKLNSATCWGADGNFVDPTGRTCAGRFRRQVPIASGDALQLIATAELIIDSAPGCEMVDTPDGPQCLVKPWNASGHAISDPYVFIDPAWEYASWFKLEMSADETDSVWVTPERTHLDPETLTLLSDGGVPLADDGGVDRVDGGADGRDGGVDTGGDQDAAVGPGATSALDAGTTGGSGKQSGGGCQLASGNSPGSLWLLAGLLAVALRRRRRSARKRSA